MSRIITLVNDYVWSLPLVLLCLLAALYFSIGTRFVQVRRLGEMVRLLFTPERREEVGITPFQAFAMALSGRVGTGNIVGVATAIGYGGPGAVVWMWIIAFLGAGTAFAEATLAQIFKEDRGGQFRGGPAYYIERGLRCKPLAVCFALLAVVAFGLFLPPVQSNGIALSCATTFGIAPWVAGAFVAATLALVIIGGVGRIARWAQVIAPVMALLYIALALVILIVHAHELPAIMGGMLKSAFDFRGVTGGVIGVTISWGVKRGIYSNEAGQGSGAIVAAAAKVSHPVKQGLVQAFSVYIDTLLVCSATALMILACKTYGAEFGEPGVGYTIAAVGSLVGMKAGGVIVTVSLFFFAFTTIMAYYYYAETNLVYLLGRGRKEKAALWLLRFCVVGMTFLGSLREASLIWKLGDIGVGSMAWINILVVLLLSPIAFRTLRSYERQMKAGQEPLFDPEELHIRNTTYWKTKPTV